MDTLVIRKEINIDAPIERVFLALTNSAEIVKYYPLQAVESEWLVGKDVIYKGEVNGASFTDYGIIEEITSPSIYRYRYWSDNHGTERAEDNHLIIEYSLRNSATGTTVIVTQSNIKSIELYEMMKSQVWDYLLSSFKEYVENQR